MHLTRGSNRNQWIGPVYSLGQLVGGLIAAFFLDKLGRKPTLGLGAILMELSTALLVWSGNFGIVIAARVIEGVSIGFLLLGYQVLLWLFHHRHHVDMGYRSTQSKSRRKKTEASYHPSV